MASSVAHASARHNRLQALRTDLTLKQRELEEVRERLASMDKQKPAETVDFLTRACKSRTVLDTVPLPQVGNVTSLFKTAAAEEKDKQSLLKKTIAEIELQLRHVTAAKGKVEKEFHALQEKTGYTTSKLAPAAKAEVPDVDEFDVRRKINDVKKNIGNLQLICNRKASVLGKLTTDLEKRREGQLRLEETMNEVLVVERSVNERKEELRALLLQHASLDREIKDAQDRIDNETAALLLMDVAAYKQRAAEAVEQRRAEDRVLKAQEARTRTLDQRLDMIRSVLEAHRLLGPVEEVVHEMCAEADAKRASRSASAASHADPNASEPSDIASPDARGNGADDDATATVDEVIAKYSSIKTLVPDEEHLPSSILSLFQHDLQHHERQVRLREIMVQEREDTKLALIAKVKDLQATHEDTVDRVSDLKESHEREIDGRVTDAQIALQQRRQEFEAALQRHSELNRELAVLRKQTASAMATPAAGSSAANSPARHSAAGRRSGSAAQQQQPQQQQQQQQEAPAAKKEQTSSKQASETEKPKKKASGNAGDNDREESDPVQSGW